jgi:hypothetical protein
MTIIWQFRGEQCELHHTCQRSAWPPRVDAGRTAIPAGALVVTHAGCTADVIAREASVSRPGGTLSCKTRRTPPYSDCTFELAQALFRLHRNTQRRQLCAGNRRLILGGAGHGFAACRKDGAGYRSEHRHRPRDRNRAGCRGCSSRSCSSSYPPSQGARGRDRAETGAAPALITQDIMASDAATRLRDAALAGLGQVGILVTCAGGSRPLPSMRRRKSGRRRPPSSSPFRK